MVVETQISDIYIYTSFFLHFSKTLLTIGILTIIQIPVLDLTDIKNPLEDVTIIDNLLTITRFAKITFYQIYTLFLLSGLTDEVNILY